MADSKKSTGLGLGAEIGKKSDIGLDPSLAVLPEDATDIIDDLGGIDPAGDGDAPPLPEDGSGLDGGLTDPEGDGLATSDFGHGPSRMSGEGAGKARPHADEEGDDEGDTDDEPHEREEVRLTDLATPATAVDATPDEPEPETPEIIEDVEEEDDDEPVIEAVHETPKPSHFTTVVEKPTLGGKQADDLTGSDVSDIIRSFKGDDVIDGGDGDDWLRAGHGDDEATGGSGNDVVDGGKGDDRLVYTLAENEGDSDYYDGGKGNDTLVLRLTPEEHERLADELADLEAWMAENANVKRSSSHGFNDASANSAQHPVYETSFGLTLRNIENLEVEILEPEPEPEPEIEPEPEPEPEPTVEEIKVDVTAGEPTPVSVALRPGGEVTLSIDVEVRELPPKFDVFLVQDLSGSFYNDLPNVQAQFPSLVEGLSAESDVAFGVGSFVDKPTGSFGSEGYTYTYGDYTYSRPADYVYKTDLAVSEDAAVVQEALNALSTLSGADWPESQLEALVQTALRGDEIGFRDGAQKFVVLSTDAPPHVAGDYADASEGANDYDTELEDEDYPDPAIVGELLKSAGITPVFAVTAAYVDTYQALVDSWGVGSVTELASDSSNLVDAITSGIKAATVDLTLDVNDDDYGFVSGMTPEVYEDAGPGLYTFDITLEIPADAESYGSDSLSVTIPGYGEIALEIEIASTDVTGDAGADTLAGDAGANAIYGLAGDDVLDGRGGDDTIEGGADDDDLTGGLGNDIFVFADGDGADTIRDFEAGAGSDDVLDLRRLTSAGTAAEVLAAATQVGDDTVFDFGDGDTVTLLGVDKESLHEDDVLV